MKIVIVLAMQGVLPSDLPKKEMRELFSLHTRLEHATGDERVILEQRYAAVDARVRKWPRTPQNDPLYAGSQKLAEGLAEATGREVILGFTEFCAPSLDDALEQAITQGGAQEVVIVTPMMTPGDEYHRVDIPACIEATQARHPEVPIVYAWPFEVSQAAQILAAQISRFVRESNTYSMALT